MFRIESEELRLAISSVLQAGKIVREIYNTSFSVSWKSKDDPLTEADLQANQIIIKFIQSKFPEDGILSEEVTDSIDRLKKDRVWIIDPIDGTREFVQKNPEFSISLGFSFKGIATIGVVLNPITKELIIGLVGSGIAYIILNDDLEFSLDSLTLKANIFKEKIAKPTTFVSRSEFEKYKLFDNNPYWKENFELKPLGSIAYKLALTAANKSDLSISLKPKSEWDICAGVALIVASGGIVIDLENQKDIPFNSQNPRHFGILAGNPHLVNVLIKEKGHFFRESLVDWK